MNLKSLSAILIGVLLISAVLISLTGCGGGGSETTAPEASVTNGAAPTENGQSGASSGESDSIVMGTIYAIRAATGDDPLAIKSDYKYTIDFRIKSSEDVSGLFNPTKDLVGKSISANTDEDMTSFKQGDSITAHVALIGETAESGYYIYDIAKK